MEKQHSKKGSRRVEVLTFPENQEDLDVIAKELALTDTASIYRAAARYMANRLRRIQDSEE